MTRSAKNSAPQFIQHLSIIIRTIPEGIFNIQSHSIIIKVIHQYNPIKLAMHDLVSLKDTGNQLFKAKKFTQAIQHFNQVITLLQEHQGKPYLSPHTQQGKLYVIALINAGFASINLNTIDGFSQAIDYCSRALAVDPQNVKGLYRRGLAKKQKAQMLQMGSNHKLDDILEIYQSSKSDFEELCLIDKKNELATKNLSLVIKDIYRVQLAKGDGVQLSGSKSVEQNVSKKSPYQLSDADWPKRKGKDMQKIMKDYKIEEVAAMVQDKLRKQYLEQPLPKLRSELQKGIRAIQKNEDLFIKFAYRLSEEYLTGIEPTFDILAALTNIIVNKGEGQEARSSLRAIKNQKSYRLLWKSFTKKEKENLIQKWVELDLPQTQFD